LCSLWLIFSFYESFLFGRRQLLSTLPASTIIPPPILCLALLVLSQKNEAGEFSSFLLAADQAAKEITKQGHSACASQAAVRAYQANETNNKKKVLFSYYRYKCVPSKIDIFFLKCVN